MAHGPAKKRAVLRRVQRGDQVAVIAREEAVGESTVWKWIAEGRWKDAQADGVHPSGRNTRESRWALEEAAAPGEVRHGELSDVARKALDDFAFFRRRYFGRKSTPWQEEAAYRVVEFMATPDKEFVVINCPPGSGKSTLFTLDIPAWLTCRQRGLRGLIGSASANLAKKYLLRLRTHLETSFPVLAEAEEKELGLGFDADATLVADFGLFKPAGAVLWTQEAFIVAQADGRPITEKEPTWSAVGLESVYIGGRYDVCIWDDAEDDRMLRSLETIDKHRSAWDKVAEKRLEPGGLLILQGQRLGPEDIYRYCLDKQADVDHDGCCSAESGRKYHHIVFRAHSEDRCQEVHGRDAPYYPDGCLLDPHRLPWRELSAEMKNGFGNFMQVYQQEDVDPQQSLVNPVWVVGGTDPRSGVSYPGCWDRDRGVCELPSGLSAPLVSFITTDPSATKQWSVQWWVYHPDSGCRFLMDLLCRRMTVNQYLDFDTRTQDYDGVLHEWVLRSRELGWPVTAVVWERNAAQRYFLAQSIVREWEQRMGVQIIAHDTFAANKLDKDMGVQRLGPLWARGLVRLPGRGEEARLTSLWLVQEAQRWPNGRTEDNVMAQWFGEFNLEHMWTPQVEVPRMWRPSWMRAG